MAFSAGARAGAFDVALSLASTGEGGYPTIHDDRRNNLLLVQGELPLGECRRIAAARRVRARRHEAQNVNAAYPGTFERDFVDTNQFQSSSGGGPSPRRRAADYPPPVTGSTTATPDFPAPP